MSFYPACGANWFQLLPRRIRAWNLSFNIVLKYRYALCRTRQKNAYVRYSCHRISNNWQLRWSTNDQDKNMVAAMSVHGHRVQLFYSSLDTTIFSTHITCAIITLAMHMFQIKPKLRYLGENRRCKTFACCWRNWNKAQKLFVHFGIFDKRHGQTMLVCLTYISRFIR